jgi:pimeloyl-ACP methyl ester carboxylesterase
MTDYSVATKLDPREQHFRIPGPREGLSLFLRFLPTAATKARRRATLYIHGATFPSALSIAHRFEGHSWRDALNEAGFDVWGLDFYGFGHSDRYPEMDRLSMENPPHWSIASSCSRRSAGADHDAMKRPRLFRRGAS